MNTNSSMSENAKITIPKSTVRTVSLEKLRQPSPLTEQSHSTSSSTQTLRTSATMYLSPKTQKNFFKNSSVEKPAQNSKKHN